MASSAAVQKIYQLIIDAGGSKEGADIFKRASETIAAAAKPAIEGQQRIQNSLATSAKSYQNLVSKIDPLARAEQALAKDLRVVETAFRQQVITTAEARTRVEQLTQRYDAAAAAARRLKAASAGSTAVGGVSISGGTDELSGTAATVAGISAAGRELRGVLATIGVGLGIRELANDLLEASQRAEKLNTQLTFVTGSQAGATAEFIYLRDTTKSLGLEFNSTASSYAKFAAATRGTALEGEQARKVFEAVAKASTVMQLSADETSGVLLALSQMVSKGTVQAEELRGQLGERLPGAFAAAARAMGVTTAQLSKMMADGKLVASDFLPKLATELDKTFGPSLTTAVSSSTAEINRFKNAWSELETIVSSGDVAGVMARGMTRFTEDATAAWRAVERLTFGVDTSNLGEVSREIDRLYAKRDDLKGKVGDFWQNQGQVKQQIEDTTQALIKLVEIRARLMSGASKPSNDIGPVPIDTGGADKSAENNIKQMKDRLADLNFEASQFGKSGLDQALASSVKGFDLSSPAAAKLAGQIRDAAAAVYEHERATKADNDTNAATFSLIEELSAAGKKRADDLKREGDTIRQSVMTPTEQYDATLKKLNADLQSGAIDQDTFGRAVAKAGSDYAGAQDPLTAFASAVDDLNNKLSRGVISIEDYQNRMRDARIALLDAQTDGASGLERTWLKFERDAGDTASIVEDVMTDAFSRIGDALADFVVTGKLNIKSLVADLAKMAAMSAFKSIGGAALGGISKLLGLFGGGGAAMGGSGTMAGSGLSFGGGMGLSFADGGSFTVDGSFPAANAGRDNRLVQFHARDGERVTVTPPEAINAMDRATVSMPDYSKGAGGQGGNMVVTKNYILNAPISISGNSGSSDQNADLGAQMQDRLERTLKGFVRETIADEQRSGGQLSPGLGY